MNMTHISGTTLDTEKKFRFCSFPILLTMYRKFQKKSDGVLNYRAKWVTYNYLLMWPPLP